VPLGRKSATLHHARKSNDGKRNRGRIRAIRAVSGELACNVGRLCEIAGLKTTFPVREFLSGGPNLTIARFLSFISTSEWHAHNCDVLVVMGRSLQVSGPADFEFGGA